MTCADYRAWFVRLLKEDPPADFPAEAYRRHFVSCAACRLLLSLREVEEVLSEYADRLPPREPRASYATVVKKARRQANARRIRNRAGTAALLFLVAAAAFLVSHASGPGSPPSDEETAAAPAPGASVATGWPEFPERVVDEPPDPAAVPAPGPDVVESPVPPPATAPVPAPARPPDPAAVEAFARSLATAEFEFVDWNRAGFNGRLLFEYDWKDRREDQYEFAKSVALSGFERAFPDAPFLVVSISSGARPGNLMVTFDAEEIRALGPGGRRELGGAAFCRSFKVTWDGEGGTTSRGE